MFIAEVTTDVVCDIQTNTRKQIIWNTAILRQNV